MMARAQNDLYMVCSSVDRKFLDDTDCFEELQSGRGITRAELQRNARNILNFAMNTPAMDRIMGEKIEINNVDCPFKADDVDMEANYFYNIDETPEIDILEQVDTSTGKDFILGVTSDVPGVYEIEITASSELNELAQIPMTIYYTSIPIKVVTWNGTNGKDVTMREHLVINSRHVVFRAHMGAAGVKLKKLCFKFVSPITEEVLKAVFARDDEE